MSKKLTKTGWHCGWVAQFPHMLRAPIQISYPLLIGWCLHIQPCHMNFLQHSKQMWLKCLYIYHSVCTCLYIPQWTDTCPACTSAFCPMLSGSVMDVVWRKHVCILQLFCDYHCYFTNLVRPNIQIEPHFPLLHYSKCFLCLSWGLIKALSMWNTQERFLIVSHSEGDKISSRGTLVCKQVGWDTVILQNSSLSACADHFCHPDVFTQRHSAPISSVCWYLAPFLRLHTRCTLTQILSSWRYCFQFLPVSLNIRE